MNYPQENSVSAKHLLFFVTEDWYFCSHRLELAKAALASGLRVTVVTQVSEFGDKIKNEGIHLVPLSMDRKSGSLFKEIKLFYKLITIFNNEKPDVIHHIAIKPILYGGLAAFLAGVTKNVYTLAGLGYAFTSKQKKARLYQLLIQPIFGFLFKRDCRVIFQNPDNYQLLLHKGLIKPEQSILIRGSGVDVDKFIPQKNKGDEVQVVLASRMIWEKGINEFVEAARILRAQGVSANFSLVGASDPGNRNAVPEEKLQQWHHEGVVKWLGASRNMLEIFNQAHIVALPSAYGEGVPKVLLEAAAAGLPIVTTDMPGCREVVKEGKNGFLVPKEDPQALALALKKLIDDAHLRQTMGNNGRKMVESEFSVAQVVDETLRVYRDLLAQ